MQDKYYNTEEGRELDLGWLFGILLRRLWLIVAAAVIFGIAGYIYAATTITPLYRSGFTAYVNNRITSEEEGKTSTGDLSASVGLSYVYKKIIESRSVLQSAVNVCGNVDTRMIRGVTAEVSDSTPVITVYAITTDAALAKQLADAVAQVAPEQVAQVVEGSSMRVIDAPLLPQSPYFPVRTEYASYGVLMGLALAVILVLITELTRDYVHSGEDVEKRYGIPTIGKIPDMLQAERNEDHYGYGKAVGKR